MFSPRKDSLWGFAYEVGVMKPPPQQARVPQLQRGQHPPSEGEGATLTGKEVTVVIHLQIEIVGDFRLEFMSRACLTCFGTKLVRKKTAQVHPSWAENCSSYCGQERMHQEGRKGKGQLRHGAW